jgi:hypothetical protein
MENIALLIATNFYLHFCKIDRNPRSPSRLLYFCNRYPYNLRFGEFRTLLTNLFFIMYDVRHPIIMF